MIHSVHTMTVGRYAVLEETQNNSLLKRWYNPLPVALFSKRVQHFFDDFNKYVNDGTTDGLSKEIERLLSYNKLLQLKNLYTGLHNLLISKTHNDAFGVTKKRRTNLAEYINKAYELTDIKIIDLESLKRFKKEIERREDKFLERYKDVEKGEPIKFIRLVHSICALMETPYNDKMTLFAFGELRQLAIEKAKKIENARNNRNNK